MTKVINIRKAPKDWILDDNYVYIGRPGMGATGIFGNPVITNLMCPICDGHHRNPGETLPCFEVYLRRRIDRMPQYKKRILALKDKTLVCFCKPGPCHGDIILRVLNELLKSES